MRNTDIKNLYNTHLRVTKKYQNKPYNLRKNFEKFEENELYPQFLKLKNFFDRNTVVNIEDFFSAPYEVYKDENFHNIDFYNTLNAVKTYNIYCSIKNNLDADHDLQIENILRGLKFIKEFCISKKIKLNKYLKYIENGDVVNTFILHLKEKNVTFYNLLPLKDFEKTFNSIDFSIVKFILNELSFKLSIFRTKFYSSVKGKQIAIKGLSLIEKEINNTLEKI